jgi:hypothetical protein
MNDDAVIAFTYVGMLATLYMVVTIPFRLGKRAARNVSDPTEKIISDTSRSLTGTAFDPFAFGSPNLPGGANVR